MEMIFYHLVTKYDVDRKLKQSDHRLDNIFGALEYTHYYFWSPEGIESIKCQFAE